MGKSLTSSDLAIIDTLCDLFEKEWQNGKEPVLREYFVKSDLAEKLLFRLIEIDVEYRRERGLTSGPSVYEDFGDYEHIVHTVLNASKRPSDLADTIMSRHDPVPDSEAGPVSAGDEKAGQASDDNSGQDDDPGSGRSVDTNVSGQISNQTTEVTAYHDSRRSRDLHASRSPHASTVPSVSDWIGPYKLLQLIGAGGMGEVWMAQQQSVRRKVAVKLIKAGLDQKQVIARFEAERQALAMMEHNHIAKVLDAGNDVLGRPYFVMELVDGIPFSEYCDKHQLPLVARLELFVLICKAVQHAHSKGIIHRDLKPANVLVGTQDGKPVPKVIDFGLAKALEEHTRLTDKTLSTGIHQVVGTVLYMSPEQTRPGSVDIDTRADVYALGVMLYEVLTGNTPVDRDARESDVLAVLAEIRDTDPPRPSTKLGQRRVSSRADGRFISRAQLRQILRGDVDWIVMKALEKDRDRRYATAEALARDVERYLNNEPVEARPPSLLYRFQKTYRRNRIAVLSLIGVLVTLVVAVSVSSVIAYWESVARNEADGLRVIAEQKAVAEAEARAAETEAKQEAIENSLVAIDSVKVWLTGPANDLRNVPGTEELQKHILRQAARRYELLAQRETRHPELMLVNARTWNQTAELHRQVGDYQESLDAWDAATEIVGNLSEADPSANICRLASAQGKATTLISMGDFDAAIEQIDSVIQATDAASPDAASPKSASPEFADATELLSLRAAALTNRCIARIQRQEFTQALDDAYAALRLSDFSREDGVRDATPAQLLGYLAARTGKWVEGTNRLSSAIERAEANRDEQPETQERLADLRFYLADLLMKSTRLPESLDVIDLAVKDYTKLHSTWSARPQYLKSLVRIRLLRAEIQIRLNQPQTAATEANAALELVETFASQSALDDGPLRAQCRAVLAHALAKQGKVDAALEHGFAAATYFRDRAAQMQDPQGQNALGAGVREVTHRYAVTLWQLARTHEFAGEPENTQQLYDAAIAQLSGMIGDVAIDSAAMSDVLSDLAAVYGDRADYLTEREKTTEAASDYSESMRLFQQLDAANNLTPDATIRYVRQLLHARDVEMRDANSALTLARRATVQAQGSFVSRAAILAALIADGSIKEANKLSAELANVNGEDIYFQLQRTALLFREEDEKAKSALSAVDANRQKAVPGDLLFRRLIDDFGQIDP